MYAIIKKFEHDKLRIMSLHLIPTLAAAETALRLYVEDYAGSLIKNGISFTVDKVRNGRRSKRTSF